MKDLDITTLLCACCIYDRAVEFKSLKINIYMSHSGLEHAYVYRKVKVKGHTLGLVSTTYIKGQLGFAWQMA